MDPYAKQARLASIAGLNSDTERTSEPTTWDVTLRKGRVLESVFSSTARTLDRTDNCPACNDAILYRIETQSLRYNVEVEFFDTNGANPHWEDECDSDSEELLDVIESQLTCGNGCTSSSIREALEIQAVYLSALAPAVS